jgi:hypothetical protein
MPKIRSKLATKANRRMITTKFRVGNRKTGRSANSMSIEDLKKGLEDSNKKKYHGNMITALIKRGVAVDNFSLV